MPLIKLDRPYFVEYIQDRLHRRNKNFLACFVGSTGSGKSYSALSLAEQVDPNFSIDQVAFKAEDFARLVQKDWPKGACLLWDETGVGLSARQWQSLANRLISMVLQTFRYKNLAVFFTVPDFSFIDSQARKLLHCLLETQFIDVKTSENVVKPLLLQTNPRSGVTYFKFLRVMHGGVKVPIKRIRLGKANEALLAEYEKRKSAFAGQLYSDILFDLERAKVKQQKGQVRRALTERQQEFFDVLKKVGSVQKAAKALNLSLRYSYDLKEAIKGKGWLYE